MALPLIAAGLSAGLGAIGGSEAEADRSKQRKLYEEMLAQARGIRVPGLAEQEITPEEYQYFGDFKPQTEGTITQDPSAFEDIQADPSLRNAEMDALSELARIGSQGGLRLSDRVALDEVTDQAAQEERGNRMAALQNMQERGMGGSGFELAALMSGNQAAANRASDEGLKTAALAEDRALQAIMGAGDLGGKIRGEDFSEEARKAEAMDQIARFNAANRQDVLSRNIENANMAALRNLETQQGLGQSNVDLRNQAQVRNKDLIQQQFGNELARNTALTGAQTSMAGQYGQDAKDTASKWSGLGQGAGQLVQGLSRKAKDPYKVKDTPPWKERY